MWNSAPRMFSGIDSLWVPRAQVSVSCAGRSGSASHASTPAVSAWAQRSFGIFGSTPGAAPQASIAWVSANWVADGVSPRASVSSVTCADRPAAAMAAA